MIGAVWGVRADEIERPLACDAYVAHPSLTAWRGVTVAAPALHVWAWIGQIRVAPYSYDWLDNGGRRSPRHLLGLPEPIVGEAFSATAGRPRGRILNVEGRTSLTGTIMGGYLTYAVWPDTPDVTRLVLKVVASAPRPLADALCLGDLVMARRQLLNLKRLAESTAW